jgi:hypothetical protein
MPVRHRDRLLSGAGGFKALKALGLSVFFE